MLATAPCKDCPDRTSFCHFKKENGEYYCEKWEAFEKQKAERYEQIMKTQMIGDYYAAVQRRKNQLIKNHHVNMKRKIGGQR